MRKWNESSAISFLTSRGADVRGKTIISKGGLKGLTSCSARDYLVNYCGYTSSL